MDAEMEGKISELLRKRGLSPSGLRPSSEQQVADRVTGFGVLLCAIMLLMLAFDPLEFGAFFREVSLAAGIGLMLAGAFLLDRAGAKPSS